MATDVEGEKVLRIALNSLIFEEHRNHIGVYNKFFLVLRSLGATELRSIRRDRFNSNLTHPNPPGGDAVGGDEVPAEQSHEHDGKSAESLLIASNNHHITQNSSGWRHRLSP